ncbi:hypothetical protein HY640_04770 [Candidatus Woesearchaeota archaeon]|nr:hypothetical protein [Candidatus Woesearchaeota archaeon]
MRTRTIETNTKASFSLLKKDITELKNSTQQLKTELAKASEVHNRLSETISRLGRRK